MDIAVPAGSRAAARVVILDQGNSLLYLHAREQRTGRQFWVMPGGGLEANERFEDAAVREVWEETGLEVTLGPCLWTRHHIYEWEGNTHDQFEVFFLARTIVDEIRPPQPDSYVIGHRWWKAQDLQTSSEHFAPTRIADLIGPVIAGDIPLSPFNCGV